MILIFFKYFYCRIDKRHITDTSCFLFFHLMTPFSNPHLTVIVFDNFSSFQFLCINKCETCKTIENYQCNQ